MAAIPPMPASPACTSIPSAADARNSPPASTAGPRSACAGPAPGGHPEKKDPAVVADFREAGLPILSVDTKKKELVGNFGNPGAVWVEEPYEVNAHDFLSDAQCRAVPYGLYDVLANKG